MKDGGTVGKERHWLLGIEENGGTVNVDDALETKVPRLLRCEYCHEAVNADVERPCCQVCGTSYRFDTNQSAYVVVASRARCYDYIALLFMGFWVAGLFVSTAPKGLVWFSAFIGFAIHYLNGIRSGVMSTRFFVFLRSWTVYRAEAPNVFLLAMFVEGLWVAGLFFASLFLW